MLDIKMIRQNPEKLVEALKKRNSNIEIDSFLKLDERRREILTVSEQLKKRQNDASKLIPQYKKEGKDTSELMQEMKEISAKVKDFDAELTEVAAGKKAGRDNDEQRIICQLVGMGSLDLSVATLAYERIVEAEKDLVRIDMMK